MGVIWPTAGLLVLSNAFMVVAWYAHLKHFDGKPLWMAVLVSWGIAFLEYAFHVPANRLGHQSMHLAQLRVLQEAISLSVFVPFAVLYMKEPLRLNFLWAGLCLVAAVYFIFKK